ncbi:cyclin-like protein, partial [Basidiobolus meristosporus CBS 931.73]
TPSLADGISAELGRDLCHLACEFAQSAGVLLKLPQVTMATAQVLIYRYFYRTSLKDTGVQDLAMGALFLASKVEESPRKIKDIINVFHYLSKRFRKLDTKPMEAYSNEFYVMKKGLLQAEMLILTKLAFNVQVQLPYGMLINYIRSLELTNHPEVPQMAWNYLNDSLRTNIYVCYQPPTIACSMVFLAARTCAVKLPLSPPWWEVFDTTLEDMEHIAALVLDLYRKKLPTELPLTAAELEEYVRNPSKSRN